MNEEEVFEESRSKLAKKNWIIGIIVAIVLYIIFGTFFTDTTVKTNEIVKTNGCYIVEDTSTKDLVYTYWIKDDDGEKEKVVSDKDYTYEIKLTTKKPYAETTTKANLFGNKKVKVKLFLNSTKDIVNEKDLK